MKQVVILAAILCIGGGVLAGTYGGGSGTAQSPYRIDTPDHWRELTDTPGDWGGHFVMTANLNLAEVIVLPVGTQAAPFTGVFDGDGHTIRNASISLSGGDSVGLFGYVDTDGRIENLGVADVLISADEYVGGLVGKNKGTISYCYITGTVHGNFNVGGLAGSNGGYISKCGAIVNVGPGWGVGGLVGYNDNYGYIGSCYARGNVSGNLIGGLAGYQYDNPDMNYAWISNCYAAGQVTTTASPYLAQMGGLIYSSLSGSVGGFWDVQTTGQATSSGGIGKTTAQMKTMSTFSDAGWDFVNTWIPWYAPEERYPELYFPMGPFTLRMQTDPPQEVSSITPSTGEHLVYGLVEIHADDFNACPNRYKFHHWEGNVPEPRRMRGATVFIDADTTITAVFVLETPVCGDQCHPYPGMDFSKNCRVDLADFALFAAEWMDCTAPECD